MKYLRPFSLFSDLLKAREKGSARLLGLDVGDKYVGVAVSNPSNKIASPLRYPLLQHVRTTICFRSIYIFLEPKVASLNHSVSYHWNSLLSLSPYYPQEV